MANRFWVGGTANWDATAGTKWALTSGGAGGQAVPTSADDVFFDGASGAVTCTIASGNTGAKSINCTGFTGTLAGAANITVAGSVTLSAGMTRTYTGTMTISDPATITSNGNSFGSLTFSGTGDLFQLADALTCSGDISLSAGTFTTNNFNVTAASLSSSNSNTRTINLGSSTVTLTGTGAVINFSTQTGLTFNAGTSTIVCSGGGAGVSFSATGGATFYNLSLTSTTTSSASMSGTNTFNNFSVAAPASAGVKSVTFAQPSTINGTLSTAGTAGNRRVWFQGSTYGIAQTLTINSAPSLTDADFRDIYVIGTAAPISGTRIGNLRGCRGITFDAPKTVYWSSAAGGTWSATNWAATSGASTSNDNFPLAQDTAVIENTGLNTSATVTLNAALPFIGTLDMSSRTNAATIAVNSGNVFYGNLVTGSGVTYSGALAVTFSGRNTQTITSAGKTFSGGVTVDSYGGTVELADALNIGTQTLTVTNGTFDTKNYNVTAGSLTSNNSNVRTINLGASTLTLSGLNGINIATSTNLTFNAGTSSIILSNATQRFDLGTGGATFYNVTYLNPAIGSNHTLIGNNTFNNLTVTVTSAGLRQITVSGNQIINGTFATTGATAVARTFICSDIIGTPRSLSVGTMSAQNCDLRDITITGPAAGAFLTGGGDCGGNTGITFPAPKTVYWNLGGTANWNATAWATESGGVPSVSNYPLAQDTAVLDNAGAIDTINFNTPANIGTFNASARTNNWAYSSTYGAFVYKNLLLSPITPGFLVFNMSGRGTQTITSNGASIFRLTLDSPNTSVVLADALTIQDTVPSLGLLITFGTFDASSYNVTCSFFNSSNSNIRTIKMGSGTWTISGTNGTVWNTATITNLNFYKNTANIVLSNTSTTARTFAGGALSYNKLTIGGTTGTSTLTITGNNQFTELASTKTVAHTIALDTTTQTFGAWTVTGTVGNVVTLTGTGTSHILAGACTSGIDYLAMGSIGFAATSPGEFYAGANSTGTAAAPVYRTAKPADSTRYWVGGTGNWSDTARWSDSSGGGSGASVPRSHDDVVFDSLSNATAYTATVNAVTGGIRTKALTIAGPLTGNLTLAGSTAINGIHGNVSLAATGVTRTYTGAITVSGSTTGKTINTNGVILGSTFEINGVGSEWGLGGAISSNLFRFINGTFSTNNYNLTTQGIASNYQNSRTINLGSSTISISGFNQPLIFGTTENERAALSFSAGTSEISIGATSLTFSGNNQTFYNVSFTGTSSSSSTFNGANIFNNLSVTGITAAGLKVIAFTANQTINGTLTLSAGTNATMRTFLQSDVIGTTRTLTCAAVSATDTDFRDITIAGAAAPVSGTRLGDGKGNSGITFDAAKTVYWNLAGNNNWSATGWAASSGASPAVNNFPLAQDTAVFEATSPATGATTTINAAYNIGTIDMSARTTNTMTLACSAAASVYGNWVNGTGVTISGIQITTFAGRGSQTITSVGRTFSQGIDINSPGGSVTVQDAFTNSRATTSLNVLAGTFDANGYSVTLTGNFSLSGSTTRTVAVGSGTWSIAGTSPWNAGTSTNLTVTGTGTISLTSASAKTFEGGGISYSGITLNQGGAGTLTISGNNTFANITNTYKATGATTIALGTTTQRVGAFGASGEAGRVLTVTGTSATSPATLVFTGSGRATTPSTDYLNITGVRAYNLADTWYAGTNSTNNGSLGWLFSTFTVVVTSTGNMFLMFN